MSIVSPRTPSGRPETTRKARHDHIKVLFEGNYDVVLSKIFKHLSPMDIENCKLVSRLWYDYVKGSICESKAFQNVMVPQKQFQVKENWKNHEIQPIITHRFPLGGISYRHIGIVADVNDVVVSLGNSTILIWNRVTMKEVRVNPFDRRQLRSLGFDSLAPKVTLTQDGTKMIVYYPHVNEIYIFDRMDDFKLLQVITLEQTSVQQIAATESWLVIVTNSEVQVFEASDVGFTLKCHWSGPASGITCCAVDDAKVFIGNKDTKEIKWFAASSGIQVDQMTVERITPKLMAVSFPWLVISGMETTTLCLVINLREKRPYRWFQYPHMSPENVPLKTWQGFQCGLQILNDRVLLTSYNTELVVKKPQVFYHTFNINDTMWSTPRLVHTHFGIRRRMRHPACLLEDDALILCDESGDVVVKSFWRTKSAVNGGKKAKPRLPLWRY